MRIVETIVGLAVEGFEPQHGMNTMHYKLRYSKTTLFLGGRGKEDMLFSAFIINYITIK